MARTIVVCCDGTQNSYATHATNIYKMCRVLERRGDEQAVCYIPGVGTLGNMSPLLARRTWVTRKLGSAIGYGLHDNVLHGYRFLCDWYRPGDDIYLFGFSRGAFTAATLAAMVHAFGLLRGGVTGAAAHLLDTLTSGRDRDERFRRMRSVKKNLSMHPEVPIEFVGLFDNVSSVGWFWDPFRAPPFSTCNPGIRRLRHAVAIDERRAFFPAQRVFGDEVTDFKERYFAGVHSDLGGGYARNEQQLAQIAFEWMLDEALRGNAARPALKLKDDWREVTRKDFTSPDAAARQHESLDWKWFFAEFVPRSVGWTRFRWDPKSKEYETGLQFPLRVNLFRRRRLPADAVFHPSVLERWRSEKEPRYRPGNCPDLEALARQDPSRFRV